ncbi:sensor histidine kinase [Actinomadura rupiterrae]|uniref:sensor histidine kinase n=1 Tax=Actinomadura rupiterrae TaxID=559627 RepID=UPI0020A5EB39|nr:histidine kinase [Actinomadura rupiterrae]MCP2335666.1 signal transduction histidine kinase [Actinomadura rupiterrae]
MVQRALSRVNRADVAVTAAVTAATAVPALGGGPAVLLLALLASVPVLWRRSAPLPVGIVVGTAMTGLVLWEKPFLPYGPLVAVYTIAAESGARTRIASIPLIGVGVYISLALPHEDSEVYRSLAALFVAAYALGTGTRARRARAAELAERERRLAGEREAAAERERARIARDMHDIVTHSVGIMVVQAETGPVVLAASPARAEAVFESIADTGRGALTQLRSVLGTLRPAEPSGPAPGLDTLPDLVEGARRAGLDAVLDVPDPVPDVPPAVAVAAYRIVQEALTNTIRHAGASKVAVRLRPAGGGLRVEVRDDGSGSSGKGSGRGLVGMRERAAACGGTLHAGPVAGGRGFAVEAVLPMG